MIFQLSFGNLRRQKSDIIITTEITYHESWQNAKIKSLDFVLNSRELFQ